MMKHFSLLLVCLGLCAHLFAQIRTGGGTFDKELRTVEAPDEGGSAPSETSKKVRAYTSHLKDRDRVCRSGSTRYLDFDPDLMAVYLKLSVLKSVFVADEQCADSRAYFKCISDEGAQEKLKILLKDKDLQKYMKENYGTTPREAKGILKFFKGLQEGCPGDTCRP